MKATSIALCRVSTVKQSVEGNSLEAQEKRVYEASNYVQAPIEKFWSLSVSSRKGKNYKRRDLHEMLSYAKQYKRVQYIIVDEVDRFMRSFEEFYYWKVLFREEAGARLVIASKPHLTYKDDMYSLFEEMIDVFKAEASNQERITKTTEKMQARVAAGYYPGNPKPGYRRTLKPGLHEPKEPEWTLIMQALKDVASQKYTVSEALHRLVALGYTLPGGGQLDMERFKSMLIDPYYAGIVQFSNWEQNIHGLHAAMISREEHEVLKHIVSGKKKIAHKQFNPKYPLSNVLQCTECIKDHEARYPRVVGYDHNNGKQGSRRKVYEKYRCRSCKKEHKRADVHGDISKLLKSIEVAPERKEELLTALRTVWERENQDNAKYKQTLETRLGELQNTRNSLVLSIAQGRISDEDASGALQQTKLKITEVEGQISDAEDIEQDFIEFVDFTMDFINRLQKDWWSLDQKHLGWCKQLLFPEGFSVSRSGKVYTPKISEFYRVATTEKGSEEPSISQMVIGSPIWNISSKRPGRSRAGSKPLRLFVAPTTRVFGCVRRRLAIRTFISLSSARRVPSLPVACLPNRPSISSKNNICLPDEAAAASKARRKLLLASPT